MQTNINTTGWACDYIASRACRPIRTASPAAEWADSALIARGEPHPTSGEILVDLSRLYDWGDQAAQAYAVYSPTGAFIRLEIGCGDQAPEPITGPSSWEFTDQLEKQRLEWAAADARFQAALARGNAHLDAAHIRACYSREMNPLPSCRKAHGGTWKWCAATGNDAGENDVLITQHVTPHTTEGYGWCVIFTPYL